MGASTLLSWKGKQIQLHKSGCAGVKCILSVNLLKILLHGMFKQVKRKLK